jgi:hypothetical protein
MTSSREEKRHKSAMESLDKILPVIIFIIWTALSVSASRKKKKAAATKEKRQSVPSMRQNEQSRRSEEMPYKKQQVPPGKSFLEQIKQGLSEFTKELAEGANIPVKPEYAQPVLPVQIATAAHTETFSGRDNIHRPVQNAPVLRPVVGNLPPAKDRIKIISDISTLKQAVIWSEIIGPPVSMR